ncbi:hypothetical protein [Nocardia sp. NPDC048505]|uniref:hypothetical protein n=1 Tax=unclassified Nocardia TaxID=2637762 RepID=UPI0033D922F7
MREVAVAAALVTGRVEVMSQCPAPSRHLDNSERTTKDTIMTMQQHIPAETRASGHPVRWKMWLLTLAGLYPLLVALVMVTAPLLEPLPTPLRLACIMPVAVAAMVWGVMPVLTRRFAHWLSA